MNYNDIDCPRCSIGGVRSKISFGGPAVYKRLVCDTCGFKGGRSRAYIGESVRVETEIKERFSLSNTRDACADFCESLR